MNLATVLDRMSLALHFAALLAGLYIFSLTVFMKESAKGRWVNRIEEFWIRVDERRRFAGATTKALFNLVAEKVTRTINRIVGSKVISVRLIGISGCLSFTCLFFSLGLLTEALSYFALRYHDIIAQHTHDIAAIDRGLPLLIILGFIFFGFGSACIALAVLAINLRSSVWAWFSCAPTAIVNLLFLRLLYLHQLNGGRASIFIALVISLASDVLLLIAIRQSMTLDGIHYLGAGTFHCAHNPVFSLHNSIPSPRLSRPGRSSLRSQERACRRRILGKYSEYPNRTRMLIIHVNACHSPASSRHMAVSK